MSSQNAVKESDILVEAYFSDTSIVEVNHPQESQPTTVNCLR